MNVGHRTSNFEKGILSWSEDDGEYVGLCAGLPSLSWLVSVHPKMANLPDIFVALKILSSEYQPYAPQGHFLWAPAVNPS